jgi:hypothetical protein
MDENRFVVHQGKIITWVGIICIMFFGTILAFAIIDSAEWWANIIFLAFILLGIYITA